MRPLTQTINILLGHPPNSPEIAADGKYVAELIVGQQFHGQKGRGGETAIEQDDGRVGFVGCGTKPGHLKTSNNDSKS